MEGEIAMCSSRAARSLGPNQLTRQRPAIDGVAAEEQDCGQPQKVGRGPTISARPLVTGVETKTVTG